VHISDSNTKISIGAGQGRDIQSGASIMQLRFMATKDGTLSEMLKIDENGSKSEAYLSSDLEVSPISLEWVNKIYQQHDFIVHTNTPNPWYNNTTIKVELPKDGVVDFQISDSQGKTILADSRLMNMGSNEINITNDQIPSAGIYFYEISFDGVTKLGKMVKIN